MNKMRFVCLNLLIFSLTLSLANAAEIKNEAVRQEGNRVMFMYDLEGTEAEGEVNLTLTIKDKKYTEKDLHLEGDIGKVKTGKDKKIYWNVLQDFPKGISGEYGWELNTVKEMLVFIERTSGIKIPLDNALIMGDKNAKHKIVVFDDPE